MVNDDKISAIGRYLRNELQPKIQTKLGEDGSLFDWEIAHRSDRRRKRRKLEQLFIDLLTFVFSGMATLVFFWLSTENLSIWIMVLSIVEFLLLLVLGAEILMYADLKKSSRSSVDND